MCYHILQCHLGQSGTSWQSTLLGKNIPKQLDWRQNITNWRSRLLGKYISNYSIEGEVFRTTKTRLCKPNFNWNTGQSHCHKNSTCRGNMVHLVLPYLQTRWSTGMNNVHHCPSGTKRSKTNHYLPDQPTEHDVANAMNGERWSSSLMAQM